jgi:hypothetical protein
VTYSARGGARVFQIGGVVPGVVPESLRKAATRRRPPQGGSSQTPSEGTLGRAMRLKWQEQRPNSGRGG